MDDRYVMDLHRRFLVLTYNAYTPTFAGAAETPQHTAAPNAFAAAAAGLTEEIEEQLRNTSVAAAAAVIEEFGTQLPGTPCPPPRFAATRADFPPFADTGTDFVGV